MNQANEFVFLFRQPVLNQSPEKQEEIQKNWMDWIGGIAAQGKIASNGLHLTPQGSVLKTGGIVTDGPFVEIREMLGGYWLIKAASLDEAVELAKGCPALQVNGSVEVRPILG